VEFSEQLYRKMYLVRAAEEKITEYYHEDGMKTPMHMSVGGEAIACGIISALHPKDPVCGTYRTHALYFAAGGDVNKFFAEMYGKEGGTCNGKAGSMHLMSPENGLICTTAVVATNIPVALGAAFAAKQKHEDRVAVAFFGDGAVDEGAFWESLNVACLFKLPVIFAYEDNGFAVHTPPEMRHGYKSLEAIVEKFNCNFIAYDDSNDVECVYAAGQKARETCVRTHRPSFLSFKYYRYLEHVGVYEDFKSGYRSKEEYLKWREKDPIALQRNRLLETYDESKIDLLEHSIRTQVHDALVQAKNAKFPDSNELYKDVFYAR